MSSNSVCNHTRDKQIELPLRGRPILLSLVWLQTELDSTQSYYHYLLAYTTQVNITFRARWLASSEVISQVLFTSEQPKKNKAAFVGMFSQIKLLFGR